MKPVDTPWMLPEGIEEILPAPARRLEQLRRRLLNLFDVWGYDLVIPPMLEYLESLLVGTGEDLDLLTFKLVDQRDGRMLGVRADMTPQVARIDAHRLRSDLPSRLCYMGSVVRTRPDDMGGSRSPIQLGAELYGNPEPSADAEVISLMLALLREIHVVHIHLDLGHVGIFRALCEQAGLSGSAEVQLFGALQRKANPEIQKLLADLDIGANLRAAIATLSDLHGTAEVLDQARARVGTICPEAQLAIDNLEAIVGSLATDRNLEIFIDLAELRGYRYHTGAVFAAYVTGRGQEVARGGRYDAIGEVFGRARPATGFSTDLKTLSALDTTIQAVTGDGVMAEWPADESGWQAVNDLRRQGIRVVLVHGREKNSAEALGCNRRLLPVDGEWKVVPLG